MQIKLAIVDTDEIYVERLTQALEEFSDLTLSIFTEKNAFINAEKSRKFDVALVSNAIEIDRSNLKNVVLTIVMYDPDFPPEAANEYIMINKYQSGKAIYKKLTEELAELKGDVAVENSGNALLIPVFSMSGGSGKTTIALATAMQLTSMGKRCLYLSLEDADATEYYFQEVGNGGLTELFSKLDSKINLRMKLKSLVNTTGSGLNWISGFDSLLDLGDIEEEDIDALIELIVKADMFDVIIVDLGSSLSRVSLKMMDKSDKIILVENFSSDSAIHKMNRLKGQTNIAGKYSDKFYTVCNFAKPNEAGNIIGTPLGNIQRVIAKSERNLPEAIARSGMLNASELIG